MPAHFLWQSRVQRTFRREPLKAFSFSDDGVFDFEEEEDGLDSCGLDLHKRKDEQSNARVLGGGGKMELEVEIVGEVGSKEAQLRAPAEMTPAR